MFSITAVHVNFRSNCFQELYINNAVAIAIVLKVLNHVTNATD